MASSTNPNDVIQLPRLRPGDLATLMLELASTARGTASHLAELAKTAKKKHSAATEEPPLPEEVPARVLEALGDLETARPELVKALQKSDDPENLTPDQRALDAKMNASWRCVRLTLALGAERATMAADEDRAKACRAAEKRVLPEGLSFIARVGRDEYSVSDTYLGVLEGEFTALFAHLPGGTELLRDVRKVHDEYGRVFFITAPAPVSHELRPSVAAAMTEAGEATREFVAAVLGTVRRADPRTRALAERLLAPLANYGRPATTPTAKAPPDAPPPPTPPAAPGEQG